MADAVAAYGDADTVWVLLLGAFFIYNRRVCNILPEILGGVLVVYDMEGASAVESFYGTICASFYSLAEAAHFIGV